jgi:cytochrome b
MEKVKVWDLPIRVFHWSIVALVGLSWGAAELGWMQIHLWSGLAVLTLVIFRISWGFVGSTTARFSNFIAPPRAGIEYAKAVFYNEKPLYAGHNPAGGWVVLGFIVLLGVQATLGLFSHDDILFKGPLAYMVSKDVSDIFTELHEAFFNMLLALIGLHVAAVFFYLFFRQENLIRPMVTGLKDKDHVPPATKLSFTNPAFAVILLALSGALVWWIIK